MRAESVKSLFEVAFGAEVGELGCQLRARGRVCREMAPSERPKAILTHTIWDATSII